MLKKIIITIIIIVVVLLLVWLFIRQPISEVEESWIEEPEEVIEKPKEEREEVLSFADTWKVYEEFRSAINNRDLDKLYSIAYNTEELSQCFDSFGTEQCWEVFKIMNDLMKVASKSDITDVWKDDKQAILSTPIKETETGYGRFQLFFVRDSEGKIRFLSIEDKVVVSEKSLLDSDQDGRLDEDEDCSANTYKIFPEECIETDPNNKDTDGDGWWDGIEVKVGTDPNDPEDYPFK